MSKNFIEFGVRSTEFEVIKLQTLGTLGTLNFKYYNNEVNQTDM